MAERDLRPELEQPGCLRGHDRALVEVELASGTPDRADVTGRLGRRDEQEPLGRRGKRTNLTEEVPFESPVDRERLGELRGSGELVGRQLPTELDERERVPTRVGEEASADVVGQWPPDGRVQQRAPTPPPRAGRG